MSEETELEVETYDLDPRISLVQWANQNDEWVQRIVRHILNSDGEMTPEEQSLTYQLLLEEKGFKERVLPTEPVTVVSNQALEKPEPLNLARISNVKGVNALVENAQIEFTPGLTLLFGENGTGKTGYARILKCLAGSRSADEILSDIFQEGDSMTPYAEIDYHIGGAQSSYQWTGEQAPYPFTLMSVFDSPSVHFHTDDNLDFTYRPATLALFDRVTQEVNYIAGRIDTDLQTLTLDNSTLLGHFDRRSTIYSHVKDLGASSDLSVLRKLSTSPGDAEDKKNNLEFSIAGLRAGATRHQIVLQEGLQKVIGEAISFTTILRDLKVQDYNFALEALNDLRRAQTTLRDGLFAAADLPAPPDPTWETFIGSGQDYKRHLEDLSAHDDTRCLYCRQVLSQEAILLMAKYRDYLEGQIARDIQEQEESVTGLVKAVRDASLETVKTYLADVDGDNSIYPQAHPNRIEALRDIVNLNIGLQQKLTDELPIDENASVGITDISNAIQQWISDENENLIELRHLDANQEKSLKEKQDELIELKACIELSRSWMEIEQFVASAQCAAKLQDQRAAITTIRRRVTNLSTKASEQLTNNKFESLFLTECSELRAPELRLEFLGRKGSTQRRRTLPSAHKPSRVFSEGEQKVLAIADFIAETRMSDNAVPVIFDDPVSSLDHRRVKEVANRIADLVSDHQVVVFTHDIFFVTCLLNLFEGSGQCIYYRVTDEDGKGTITPGTGPRWDTIKSLRAKINVSIEEAKRFSGEEREAHVRDAYSSIRSWCEVFIEGEVLAQVTQRYQPNVRMTQLDKIKVSALKETIETVTSIFNDACRYIEAHSQPLPSLSIAPTLTQLEEDWKILKACRDKYRNAPG